VAESIGKALAQPLAAVSAFFRSFVKELMRSLSGTFDIKFHLDNPFDDMFDSIGKKSGKLDEVASKVSRFARHVKEEFYDIWDKVVGHSYWPDLVDGVVDYTRNLFGAESAVDRFGRSIKSKFQQMYKSVTGSGADVGNIVAAFTDRLSRVKWGEVVQTLTGNIGSAVVAGVLLAFGSPRMRLAGLSYFISLFNVSLNGAFSVITPVAATAAGAIGGEFAAHFVVGTIKSLGTVLGAVPAFIESFIVALMPNFMSGLVRSVFSFIPVISNNLIVQVGALGAAIVLLSKRFTILKGLASGIMNITFGRKGKKTKDGIGDILPTEGLVPLIKAMSLSWIPAIMNTKLAEAAQKVNPARLFDVFRSKNFAIAGAAALSAAMLDSVSLVEAAQLGIPLLGMALLGPNQVS